MWTHLLLWTSLEVLSMMSDMVSVSICCITSLSGRFPSTPNSFAHSRTATPPLGGEAVALGTKQTGCNW